MNTPSPLNFAHNAEKSLPVIYALSGPTLTADESDFFKDARPLGFILFNRKDAKNVENPDQLRALTDSLRNLTGRNCPVLIDQEGGRVQRLRPPHWREYKPFQYFGDLYRDNPEQALEELRFETLRLAEELCDSGINVNCSPCLDVLAPQTHDIIGDRAFSDDPDIVGRLGLSVARHFLGAGIQPIIKHIPGHGKAEADSHLELPVVTAGDNDLAKTDFKPFSILAESDIGKSLWAMTAHIQYPALDPDMPATLSKTIIHDVIRKKIGFEGIIISDDLTMKALDKFGSQGQLAKKTIEAGCDIVLHCKPDLKDMQDIANNLDVVSADTLKRLNNSAIHSNIIAA